MINAHDRLWPRVEFTGFCWLWRGAIRPDGYGVLRVDGKQWRAHRLAHELLVGPVPFGMVLDHLCRVRNCVNPDHLEVVTRGENVVRSPITVTGRQIRQTDCVNGHRFDKINTWRDRRGRRHCKACWVDRAAARAGVA